MKKLYTKFTCIMVLFLLFTQVQVIAQNDINIRHYSYQRTDPALTVGLDVTTLDAIFDNVIVNGTVMTTDHYPPVGSCGSMCVSALPTSISEFDGVDMVYLRGLDSQHLSQAQADVLVEFVKQGGILIGNMEGCNVTTSPVQDFNKYMGERLLTQNGVTLSRGLVFPGSTMYGYHNNDGPLDLYADGAHEVENTGSFNIINGVPPESIIYTYQRPTIESQCTWRVIEFIAPSYPGDLTAQAHGINGFSYLSGETQGPLSSLTTGLGARDNTQSNINLANLIYDFMYDPEAMAERRAWSMDTDNQNEVCPVTTVTNDPEECPSGMILAQGTNTELINIDTSDNPLEYPSLGASGIMYNAIGANPVDGKIYGLIYNTNTLIQINKTDGSYVSLGNITGLPASTPFNSGEIDDMGNYYVAPVGPTATMYKIDITTMTATTIALTGDIDIDPSDFAYNVNTGLLYGVNSGGRMISIDPVTGQVIRIGAVGPGAPFGAMFGSNTGDIYGISNAGGFYQFNIETGERVLISDSPASTNNDGAHCVNQPITFDADLSVTKTDGIDLLVPGTTTTYTIVVENNGPFGVLNASVTDTVPAGIPGSNVSYTAVASAGSFTDVSGTQTGDIDDLVSLPVDGTVTYTVTIDIPADFTGDLVNTVTVTPPANINDPDTDNNSAIDVNSDVVCTGPDTDGDGIPDMCDADDDNDGILDIDECSHIPTSKLIANTNAGHLVEFDTMYNTFSTLCTGISIPGGGIVGDIAMDADGTLWGITSTRKLIQINPDNCSVTEIVSDLGFTGNGLSMMPDGNLLAGSGSSSIVRKIDVVGGTYAVTAWHDFSTGNSNGDFIFIGNKVYVLWFDSSINPTNPILLEAEVDTDFNYISHTTMGELPRWTWGLTKVNGDQLYGVTGIGSDGPPNPEGTIVRIETSPSFSWTNVAPYTQRFYGATSTDESILECDTDGDGIPNRLDLDSDNDGCLDAIEGDGGMTDADLVDAAGTVTVGTGSTAANQNLCADGSCVDANGIPLAVNGGQGAGSAHDAGVNGCMCAAGDTPPMTKGVDVIFWMDNSQSINTTEWDNMTASTQTLIDEVLGCNPNNRVAVVHYGATAMTDESSSMIYIESDFTNDATTAKDFLRRGGNSTQGGTHYSEMGVYDFAPAALGLIGNALDGSTNANIISTQKSLTRDTSNRLVVFLFNDAQRDYNGGSHLVSSTGEPFAVYNQFKSDREATFVVLHAPTGVPGADADAEAASAAIASVGGTYTGLVEVNPEDPQGSGITPRRAIMSATFSISTLDIEALADNICKVNIDVSNTCPETTVDLTLQDTGTEPAGAEVRWFTTEDHQDGTQVTDPTAVGAGAYYAFYYHIDEQCYSPASIPVVVTIEDCPCVQPGAGGSSLLSSVGILTKGSEPSVAGWPETVPNGYLVIDAAGKGMVVTHMTTAERDALTAIKGMVIYNTDLQCVQIYRGNDTDNLPNVDPTRFGWQCIERGCNE